MYLITVSPDSETDATNKSSYLFEIPYICFFFLVNYEMSPFFHLLGFCVCNRISTGTLVKIGFCQQCQEQKLGFLELSALE